MGKRPPLKWLALPAVALAGFLVSFSVASGGAFPGDNGKLAYTCGANVCTVGPSGSGKTTLLTGATDPSWSGDGTQLAYVDATNGVSVADADGNGRAALGAGSASTEPTFSPDAQRVAYVRAGDLWSILSSTLGQEQHLTTGSATDADPAYSPDGSELAFARDSGSGYDIWTLDLGSSTLQHVTTASGNERHPTWSPDGSTIVYSASSNGHLFSVSAAGGTPTDLNVSGTDPTYAPDGTKIAYIDASGHLVEISTTVAASPTVTSLDSSGTFSDPDWQSAASSPTPVVTTGPPVNVSYPSINLTAGDSTPLVGHLLTASVGAWNGETPITYTYQWKRCQPSDALNGPCGDISGATSSFYVPTFDDYKMRLRVEVTAKNGRATVSQNSPTSDVVGGSAPKNTATPQIVGQIVVGQTLSLTTGTWSGSTPITYTYSWRRCNPQGDPDTCVQIPGATSSTYVPVPADIGIAIRVWITGTNPIGADTAITNHTFPIVDRPHFAPQASTSPSIAAMSQVSAGRQLIAQIGTFTGDEPISTTFAWQRCDATGAACQAIAGATRLTYMPGDADVGSTLRLEVTATNAIGTVTVDSDPTETVAGRQPHHKGRHIVGGAGNDYLAGSGFDDVISGLAGNDTLLGGAGYDTIDGGPGNDIITGGAGSDTLDGGPGSDTIYAADGERDVVDCGPGPDRVVADDIDRVTNCEAVDRSTGAQQGGSSEPNPSPPSSP
jgi:hypothetical protein